MCLDGTFLLQFAATLVSLLAITKYRIKINGKPTYLQKWTQNDSYIMRDFHDYYQENESAAFYQSLNRFRLYLRVVTLSDLQQADGRRAHPLIFTLPDTLDVTFSNSSRRYDWPTQGKSLANDLFNWNLSLGEVYNITAIQPTFMHHQRSVEWNETVCLTATWLVSENNLELYNQYDEHRWYKWVPLCLGRTRAGRSTFIYPGRITTEDLQLTLLAHVEQETNFWVRLLAQGQIQIQQRPDRTFFRRVNGVLFDRNNWSLQHSSWFCSPGVQLEFFWGTKVAATGTITHSLLLIHLVITNNHQHTIIWHNIISTKTNAKEEQSWLPQGLSSLGYGGSHIFGIELKYHQKEVQCCYYERTDRAAHVRTQWGISQRWRWW